MIVRNEQDNLARCLNSVKAIVDEMIIVDTGSKDDTVKIAESFGAKVYSFPWKDDFSEARNYSLKYASSDWILLMDADDELDASSHRQILELTGKDEAEAYFFKTVSYIGEKPGLDTLNNLNLRLVRNGRGYFFSNPIHEQIYSNILRLNPSAKIVNLDIKIFHYGYLEKNIKGQDKRKRNISILEKELKLNPGYGFALFNLGNEYFASGSYLMAIENYEQAYSKFDPLQGYSSKLILKMVNCYMNIGRHDSALRLVEEGLGYYPEFTELEYFRALIFFNQFKYTLAIKHFEKCTAMGESPLHLNMVEGAGTYRADYLLGEIHFRLEDYKSSINYYEASISACRDFTPSLVKLYISLCRDIKGSGPLEKGIAQLHKRHHLKMENTLLDILMQEKYYELTLRYITGMEKKSASNTSLIYRKSICRLMLKKYQEAFRLAGRLKADKEYEVKAVCLQALCEALQNRTQQAGKLLGECTSEAGEKLLKVYSAFILLLEGTGNMALSDDANESAIFSAIIFELLKILIGLHEFTVFEKALGLLNMIDDKTVLLKLAKLYYGEGCYELAHQELVRSLKTFDAMDFEGADMLMKLKARGL